jgi:hypothetical protein
VCHASRPAVGADGRRARRASLSLTLRSPHARAPPAPPGGSGEDAKRFAARFQAVAARNAAAMQRALDAAYAAAVKPVVDRISPRD